MKKQKDTKPVRLHRDCRHCKPYTEGFFDFRGESILGVCEKLPHKVLLNEKTDCTL